VVPASKAKPDSAGASAITQALREGLASRPGALDRLMPLVYADLKLLARRHLRSERNGHTLDSTAIVHEAFLQLAGGDQRAWRDRAHFFAVVSKMMRHILIDYARRSRAAKRGGDAVRITLDPEHALTQSDTIAVLALDEALSALGAMDGRLEEVVECRFFAGLDVSDTARALGMSERTVERDWQRAKAYLRQSLQDGST
jgi:RNA polymerase sigma factor (TIGR02999 family)